MDQGAAFGDMSAEHAADQDVVIAGGDAAVDGALDGGQRAIDQGYMEFTAVPGDAGEAVLAAAGEALGNRPLIFPQNAEAKMFGGAETIDEGDGVAEADQHQRRIKRKGRERADGEAVRRAVGAGDGGDGDAGGEASAGLPEQLARNAGCRSLGTVA